MGPVRRRQFLLASGALLAAPGARARQPAGKIYRVGLLSAGAPLEPNPYFDAFKDALRGLGWVDGGNLVIETRYAEGDYTRLPGLAQDLVSRGMDVILPTSTPATIAASKATRTIPIVMTGILDAQESGIVQNLSRPGGNITGLTHISMQTAGKRQLLRTPEIGRTLPAGRWY